MFPSDNGNVKVSGQIISKIKRHPKLKQYSHLVELVKEKTEGLLIDDEVLDFSYFKIRDDIEKGIKDDRFRKILSSNKKDYYLFYKSCIN